MRSTFVGLLLGLSALAAIYWFMYGPEDAERLLSDPVDAVASLPVPETAPQPPEIRHPLPDVHTDEPMDAEPAEEEEAVLPPLEDSDSLAAAEMRELFGAASVDSLLVPRDIVRRFVLTVDSLDREPMPLWLRPVRRVPGLFSVEQEPAPDASSSGSEAGEGFEPEQVVLTTSQDNLRRYAPLMKMVDRIDVGAFASVYKRYYPLVQDSYDRLGNPDARYFNDRFVEIIDHLLETPEVEGPIRLVRPKVLYKFADPDLERRSGGQKALLRIGHDNASRVKAKLRQLRSLITQN